MKKINYILIVFASLILTSCGEEFLDKRPTSFISNEDLGLDE